MFAYKGSFAANTGTGNQTISGIVDETASSFTPKFVLIWSSFGTSAAFSDGWTNVVGMTDGTTSLSSCGAASDNVAAQRAQGFRSTSLIRVINSAATTLRTGAFVSFGSGQFVINWTTATGASEIFHYIALGGSDLSANVAALLLDSTATRTAISFGVLSGLLNTTGFTGASTAGAGMGWFVPKSDGTFQQGTAVNNIRDNVNPAKSARYQRTSQYKSVFQSGTDATLFSTASYDALGDAFALIGGSVNVFSHTAAFSGIGMAAGNGLQPTSTGTQAISGLGFSPKAVIVVSVGQTAQTTAQTESRLSIGGCDRTRVGHTVVGSTNSVTPSVCVSYEDTSKIISCITPNATAASTSVEAQAGINSIDTDGFTLNWTTADATQREYIWLAFGDAPAATGERFYSSIGHLGA